MNEKIKNILFIIATVLFVISICFLEVRMIFESVDAYFHGTTGGIRFFGDQTRHSGLKGVTTVLEGWGVGLLIWYSPVMLYQLIYLFIILKEKYNSIKNIIMNNDIMNNNKDEKQSEKSLSISIIAWLVILSSILLIISQFSFLSSLVFNEKLSIIFILIVITEASILIFLAFKEFIVILTILLGIVLTFVTNLNNWPLMIVSQLWFYLFVTLAFVIIEIWYKRRKVKTEN